MSKQKITEFEKLMAKLVLRAMELQQTSYDTAAADEAERVNELNRLQYRKANPDKDYFCGGVIYEQFYKMSFEQACDTAAAEAGHIALGRLVYLATESWWNDAADWAQQVLDPTAIVAPTIEYCQHDVVYEVTSVDSIPNEDERCEACNLFYASLKAKEKS